MEVKNGLLNPVQQNERIVLLDIIRGFALLGVLTVNMIYFNTPIIFHMITRSYPWSNILDQIGYGAIVIFAEGKFYTMFSFLFGLGFVIFMERASNKVKKPGLLFLRRLFILFIFGLIHMFFFWYGDILFTYAIIGLTLPLFYKRKTKTLIVWVIILLILAILPTALMVIGASFVDMEIWASEMAPFMERIEGLKSNAYKFYSEGNFSEIFSHRMDENIFILSYFFFTVPLILPMFLLGAYAARKKIFENVESFLPFIKKVWLFGLIIGFPLSILNYISGKNINPLYPSIFDFLEIFSQAIGNIALSFFYITSIILLSRSIKWMKILKPLAYIGKMTLSNYLIQTIICTTLFYGYGFGLYGKVGPALGFLLTILIFTLQIKISKIWLSKYKYGPFEWLWRTLTYGKIQPIKIENNLNI